MTSAQQDLLQRVLDLLLADQVRVVAMFGGRAVMLRDRMLVSVGRAGHLLVRVDPARSTELLALPGARPAEMGAGRRMGDGWIEVDSGALTMGEDLQRWIEVALDNPSRT